MTVTGHWWQPTAALDATRIGGQAYTNSDVRQVSAYLKETSRLQPMNVASIALGTGVPGRTIRQIVSDLDGRVMLIGKRQGGLYVCHVADESDEYTTALERHWRSERERVQRRRSFATKLPRWQQQMFADTDLAYDEDDDDD